MVAGVLPFDGPDFKTLAFKVRCGKISYPLNINLSKRKLELIDRIGGFNKSNVEARRKKEDHY